MDNWNVCRGVNIHTDIKGSVGLTLAKASVMRVSIPLDLSTRFCIPPPCFLCCRHPHPPFLTPSLIPAPRRFAKAAHDVCPCETERGELVVTKSARLR
jgi:hypothetical protein